MSKYLSILVLAAACGGAPEAGSGPSESNKAKVAGVDPAAVYAPLQVGADYESYNKVSTEPFRSPDHGKRFVEIWVNDAGLAAYTGEAEFPVGSIIVKESWETKDGKPTEERGPIFVMQKREKGYDADNNDWHYEFHWETVPAKWVKAMGAQQVYWRSPSKKVAYCYKCHENYDREVGLPAKGFRTWEQKSGKEGAN